MKTLPLFNANLKEFIRNWKSVCLLLITPLVIILLISVSLYQNQLTLMNVGIVTSEPLPDDLTSLLEENFYITEFATIDSCIGSIKFYQNYACVDIRFGDEIKTTIYYDNTRDPISWEVLQLLTYGMDVYKASQSLETVSGFLDKAGSSLEGVQEVMDDLRDVSNKLDSYDEDMDQAITDLQDVKSDLDVTLQNMDRDIREAKYASSDARWKKDSGVANVGYNIDQSQSYVTSMKANDSITKYYKQESLEQLNYAENKLDEIDTSLETEFDEIDEKIANYERQHEQGEEHLRTIDTYIYELKRKQNDLENYRRQLQSYSYDLNFIEDELERISTLDAGVVISPVSLSEVPIYPLKSDVVIDAEVSEVTAAEASSFLNLQILYPKLLFLIILFLALLISSYIALQEIHSSSIVRINLSSGTFFATFFATYMSSIVICLVPIIVLLLAGNYLFLLPIMKHIVPVMALIVLSLAFYVLVGMLVAYIVRKEAIATMMTTFVLIFIIFFSGFLYPIERMQYFFFQMAQFLPLRLGVQHFYKVVFYSNTDISFFIFSVAFWIATFVVCVLFVKALRRYI